MISCRADFFKHLPKTGPLEVGDRVKVSDAGFKYLERNAPNFCEVYEDQIGTITVEEGNVDVFINGKRVKERKVGVMWDGGMGGQPDHWRTSLLERA